MRRDGSLININPYALTLCYPVDERDDGEKWENVGTPIFPRHFGTCFSLAVQFLHTFKWKVEVLHFRASISLLDIYVLFFSRKKKHTRV